MNVGRNEFKKLAFDQKGRVERRIFVIDVRSEKEYFNKNSAKPAPDIQAVHIDWKDFFTAEGRPNPMIRKKLNSLNIGRGDRVILISSRGVRSGAAAYALTALGFHRVQNFADGWQALLK
jgi:rhodanese-related sulfurtransferase